MALCFIVIIVRYVSVFQEEGKSIEERFSNICNIETYQYIEMNKDILTPYKQANTMMPRTYPLEHHFADHLGD